MNARLGEQSPETRHFYELTPERVLTAVERFGFRCTGRVLQLNSMENRVYDVEIEIDGDDGTPRSMSERFRVVKFYRPGRWSREQILEEHQFLFDLVNEEIPAVAPLRNEGGDSLLQCPDTGIYFSVFPRAGGRSPDELIEDQPERLGRLLARVHLVGARKEAPHRLRLTPGVYGLQNLEFLQELKLIPVELEAGYAGIVRQLCAMAEPHFAPLKLQRIHGDCHFGNVLWGRDGPSLVDFDDMVMGPPVQDLWLLLPGRGPEAMKMLNAVLAGYEQLRQFDRSSLVLIEILRALRFIHFSAWIGRRWSDPAFKRAFPHFGSPSYWAEQVADLRDQLANIQQGGFVAAGYSEEENA